MLDTAAAKGGSASIVFQNKQQNRSGYPIHQSRAPNHTHRQRHPEKKRQTEEESYTRLQKDCGGGRVSQPCRTAGHLGKGQPSRRVSKTHPTSQEMGSPQATPRRAHTGGIISATNDLCCERSPLNRPPEIARGTRRRTEVGPKRFWPSQHTRGGSASIDSIDSIIGDLELQEELLSLLSSCPERGAAARGSLSAWCCYCCCVGCRCCCALSGHIPSLRRGDCDSASRTAPLQYNQPRLASPHRIHRRLCVSLKPGVGPSLGQARLPGSRFAASSGTTAKHHVPSCVCASVCPVTLTGVLAVLG